jgi:MFS family permease
MTSFYRATRQWWAAALLGLATIGAYGTAQYAIGTLLPVIAADTNWSRSMLTLGYSMSVLAQGGVAILAGREFDRRGSRNVFIAALTIGSIGLIVASFATSPLFFVLAWGSGAAAYGGGLYYSITMPAVARLYPAQRAAALSMLTFLGALAAPVFSPGTAMLLDAFGWRGAIRALVAVSVMCVLPCALLVRAPGSAALPVQSASSAGWRAALAIPTVRRALLIIMLAGAANSALLIHQVSALQAGGLTIGAASGFAGARGGFQLAGRVLLVPLTNAVGTRGAMTACYAAAVTAVAALIGLVATGLVPLALYFAVIGGMSLGLLSPLQGLFQSEAYGDEWLGRLNGTAAILVGVGGAAAAWVVGMLADVWGIRVCDGPDRAASSRRDGAGGALVSSRLAERSERCCDSLKASDCRSLPRDDMRG